MMVDGKDDYGVVLVRGPSRQIRGWFRSLEHRLKVSYCRFNVIDLADHEFIETYLTVVNRVNNTGWQHRSLVVKRQRDF